MFGICSMQGSLYSKSQLGNHNQNLKFIKDTVETLEIHMDPPIQYECALHSHVSVLIYERVSKCHVYEGLGRNEINGTPLNVSQISIMIDSFQL